MSDIKIDAPLMEDVNIETPALEDVALEKKTDENLDVEKILQENENSGSGSDGEEIDKSDEKKESEEQIPPSLSAEESLQQLELLIFHKNENFV